MTDSFKNLIKTNALIEQHVHGGFGIDFANCDAEGFLLFSKKILKHGVCAFLPTLATDSVANLKRQIEEIKKAIKFQEASQDISAKILGVHLEACFLNPLKKGIHNETQLLVPSIENYKLLEDDIIKIVTIAPELDKDFELCNYLQSKGARVSAGHCVGADLSMVNQVTHLYNAMGAFSHRMASTVLSALLDDVFVELIADFKHVSKDVVELTFKVKDKNKIILISDALPITHSEINSMEFCGQQISLCDGHAISKDGTIAGSTMFLDEIIKQLVKNNLCDLSTAIAMASDNLSYFSKQNAYLYWDNDLCIKHICINDKLLTF